MNIKPRKQYNLEHLRLILSVGEPLHAEAVRWGEETFGMPILDNWWQTETGGIMISNYRNMPVKPGSMGKPLPGIEAAIAEIPDDGFKIITESGKDGHLVLKRGWPSMFKTYLYEEERYAKCLMAEMYGKLEGCSKGRGGSMHLLDAKTKFYGGNAIVAGHLPLALGLALADKKMKRNQITCCFFGEGAVAEGEFHEAMNLASLWQIPVLWVCENNLYAMGTAIHYTHSMIDLEKKAIGYGMSSASVDGMDLLVVWKAAQAATETIRQTGKPFFLVCNTYRFRAQSMFDAELYREKTEVEEWKKRDPIPQFSKYLTDHQLLSDHELKEIQNRVETEVQKAVDIAEAGTSEPAEQLTKFVFSELK